MHYNLLDEIYILSSTAWNGASNLMFNEKLSVIVEVNSSLTR